MFSVERMIKQMEVTCRITPSAFAILRTSFQELAALRYVPFGVVAVVPTLDEILASAEGQQLLPVMNCRQPHSSLTRYMPIYKAPMSDCHPSLQLSLVTSASKPQPMSLRQQLSAPLHDDELQYLQCRLSNFSEYYKHMNDS
eukprot:TRINITY_DN3777_c0_g1_i1.p1 TRINITY_DN3777_c0_g1~~TRINITY_DN3777_c0_g1_i1.p1  ORF type:complete len:142 (-),score=16.97 TRINITY_DN3777_c0_g1_i1:675-1100(-)